MLVEQQVPERAGREQAFANKDGAPATWLETIPMRVRRRAFAWRAGIGLILAIALWSLASTHGTLDTHAVLFGMLPLCVGLIFGGLAYLKQDVRRYSVTYVSYTPKERLKRASKWWLCGVVLLTIAWGSLIAQGLFAQQWWYASPVLLIFLVGLGLYRLKGEVALSPGAAKAKAYFGAIEQQGKAASFDRLSNAGPLIRYALAAACLYAAYYLGVESTERNAGLGSIAFVFLAGLFAREISKWVLSLALVGGIIWAVIAGIAALPVSLAVIVGALIIAGAMKK